MTGRNVWLGLIVAGALAALPAAATERFFAVTKSNKLVTFTTENPIPQTVSLSGLQSGETLVGVSLRPANDELYGVGSTGRLYRIDENTGACTQIGSGTFNPALSGTHFGADFDPVTDRLRIVSDTGQNLRVDPSTGQVEGTDANLAFAPGDTHAGATPKVVAAAFTNTQPGMTTTTTTLYDIDSDRDILVRQGEKDGPPDSPNSGQLHTVGPLEVDVSEATAFDITPKNNIAYLFTRPAGASTPALFTVDLESGEATKFTDVATTEEVVGLATRTLTPQGDGGVAGDGGVTADAGIADGGTGANDIGNGCGCQSANGPAWALLLLLGTRFLALRRRGL